MLDVCTTYQLVLDRNVVFARFVKDAQLDQLCEAPVGLGLVVQGSQERSQQICHALTVADLRLMDQVVEEDVPTETTDKNI